MLDEIREKLSDFEKEVLQNIFEHWKSKGKWPIGISLAVKYRNDGDIYKMVEGLGYRIIQFDNVHEKNTELKLTLIGMGLCDGSEDDINEFFQVFQFLYKRFLEDPVKGEVTSDEIREEFSYSNKELLKFCELLYSESWIWSGASRNKEKLKFTYKLNKDFLRFENVKSMDDYVDIEKRWLSTRFGGEQEPYQDLVYHESDYSDSEESIPYIPIDISFISDSNIRNLIENDLRELHYLLQTGAWKSATILSAIVAEAILYDLFKNNEEIARKNFKNRWPNKVSLFEMASTANKANLISEPEHELFKMMTLYRNQIHPNRAYYEKRPDEYTAKGLYEFVQKILKDMRERAK